jgi:hypothetical protein
MLAPPDNYMYAFATLATLALPACLRRPVRLWLLWCGACGHTPQVGTKVSDSKGR